MSVVRSRPDFFAAYGPLEEQQKAGIASLLDVWDGKPELQDKRWLAYMLATQFWETCGTMQPCEEPTKGYGFAYGIPDPDTGQCYYGRGYIPLRWKWNYDMWRKNLGNDLVNHPENVLQPQIAALILVEGMKHGLFTGIPLGERHGGELDDPLRARQSVDGDMSHAAEIAEIYQRFFGALA
jgi:putative chitinase